jgi:uncharacterized protein
MNMMSSLGGGVLIGSSALLLYAVEGRIAGVSGIVFSAMQGERLWKWLFLIGLIAGGWLAVLLGAPLPHAPIPSTGSGIALLLLAGVLVGFGTRLANGCTSGHGVCGLARLSLRSFAAVLTFMATGMATATLLRFAAQ